MKELGHLKNWEQHIDYNDLVAIAIEQSQLTPGVMVAFAGNFSDNFVLTICSLHQQAVLTSV